MLYPIRKKPSRRAFTLLSLLMALVIVGILGQTYMGTVAPTGQNASFSPTNRARAAVAAINFRTAQTQWISRTGGNRLQIEQQRQELDKLAVMGSGGRFFIDPSQNLNVTTQIQTMKFSDQIDLPETR